MIRSVRARAPGKLVLLGEYAVLTPGEPGMVMAVDRYAEVSVRPSRVSEIWSDGEGALYRWRIEDRVRFGVERGFPRFAGKALAVALDYLARLGIHPSPFRIDIEAGSLAGPRGKYGLGSSAAVVTAVVGAVLAAAVSDRGLITPDLVFELALGAHRQVQDGGSGIDVAASVYGGFLHYRAGPATFGVGRRRVVETIKPAVPPVILVGYSGESVKTAPRVLAYTAWRAANCRSYHTFLGGSRTNVSGLIQDWQSGQDLGIARIARGRDLLVDLGRRLGLSMETPELFRMNVLAKTCGGAAKPSGSGGGDVGVAFLPTSVARDKLARAWGWAGIEVLDLTPSRSGLTFHPAV